MKHIFFLTIILLGLFSSSVFSQTDEEIKFMVDSINKLPNDTNKVIAYNDLIWQISYFDSTNSVFCADKSIELATKLEYWTGVATAQKNLAAYYYYNAAYQEALDLYEKSLENYQKAKNKKGEAIAYRNLGNVHSQIGNWETSLSLYLESLKLRVEIGDTLGKAKTYSAIGLLFSSMQNNEDSSFVYFNRALEIFIEVDDKYNIASTYLYISSVYYFLSSKKLSVEKDTLNSIILRDSAVFYSRKCINVSSEIGIIRLEATAYETIGSCFLDEEKYDSAYFYLNKSMELRIEDNNSFGIVNSLSKMGSYYLLINDYKNAEKYLKEALELSNNLHTEQVTETILANLADLYYNTGRYKLAFDFYHEHSKLKDSLYNDSKTKEMTQLSMQYEFDKKQKMQELEQQKKDAIQDAQIKRQKLVSLFFLVGFIMMIIVAFLIFRSYRQKQKTNKLLEDKNAQISLKNTQLNQSNEEIEAQRDEIERQKEFVEKQNKEITSSINYAQRIQRALLTPFAFLEKNLEDYFILYKPRDIVSGDYFWASKIGNKLVITAADCTGHGVPGAFMSMLGISFLNQIVNQEYRNKPEKLTAADILNRMREMVVTSLGHGMEDGPQEGMDMALTIIDFENNKINFAGAYNPMLLIRDNELSIIAADRMPVGYHFIKKESDFSNKEIEYKKGDRIYMFSDGYQDQFGGPDGRKFSPKQLRELFWENHQLPMQEQRFLYENIFENWRNSPLKKFRQLDDVLILGFKL
ncbi:MAG: tetratricopeptide repeat protein [Bacteroidales bacterium]|nr:tetratricopeptide repeat protein [Bacteroidales bacterium]